MLRIQRSANDEVVLKLSGRMDAENMSELEALLESKTKGRRIGFDLEDLTLVDREAVRFLARCEANGTKLDKCPAYVREWIDRERGGKS